jgi:hypothetical protein
MNFSGALVWSERNSTYGGLRVCRPYWISWIESKEVEVRLKQTRKETVFEVESFAKGSMGLVGAWFWGVGRVKKHRELIAPSLPEHQVTSYDTAFLIK